MQVREFFKLLPVAEVVKWQTRTFEGRVAQAVRVQVPPSAPTFSHSPNSRLTAGRSGEWDLVLKHLAILG